VGESTKRTGRASGCGQRIPINVYDFVEDRTPDGRKYRMLNVIDEFTHECLASCIGY